MNIIRQTNLWLAISATVIVASIILLVTFGLRLGIDFTGGSLLEAEYTEVRPELNVIRAELDALTLGSFNVQPIGETGIILRFADISEEDHQRILTALAVATGEGVVEELRFDSVGPSIGQDLKEKSVSAAVIVLILIIAYVAYSFRHVSKPVASWKYGVVVVVALIHDVLVALAVFAVLGYVMGVEIDTAFVAAILTVIGYSVNDTIVVFDRIRENLPKSHEDFAGTVNTSLKQTFGRSLNTSLTTLLVLLAIFFFGGATVHYFTLALIIGIGAGTYSSLFLASPLLVAWEKWGRKISS